MMKVIINKKILKITCIDEVHQFIDFGTSFRKSFCLLKENLFKNSIDQSVHCNKTCFPSTLTIPIIAMTATFNMSLLESLEKMIGVKFLRANVFWATKSEMRKNHINADIVPSQELFRDVKKHLNEALATENNRKCMVCGNAAKKKQAMS